MGPVLPSQCLASGLTRCCWALSDICPQKKIVGLSILPKGTALHSSLPGLCLRQGMHAEGVGDQNAAVWHTAIEMGMISADVLRLIA